MRARRPELAPEVCGGVEADDVRAVAQVVQQHAQHSEQYVLTAEVEIDLIRAEGRPHPARATERLVLRQQTARARSEDEPQVLVADGLGRVEADKEVLVVRVPVEELAEPLAFR